MNTKIRGTGLCLTMCLGLTLAACGGEGEPVVAASASPFCAEVMPAVRSFIDMSSQRLGMPTDERYGGTAVVGAFAELANGMNAAAGADYAALQHHQFVNLMTLLNYDEDQLPQPYLATGWDVSDDGTEITFRIRDDVFWHDGEQTDAHDVAFTYSLVTNPETAFPNATFWDHYEKGPGSVEVVDDFTVKIRLQPHGDFLDAWRTVAILPEHLLGDVPPAEIASHPYGSECPVGNGPFSFVSHEPQQSWVFEANPAFPEGLGGRPFLDRYVFRVIAEPTTLLTELLTGNIDIYMAPAPRQVARIAEDPDLEVVSFTGRQYVFVGWNARRAQLSDSRVRRAITMGTNRAQIVELVRQGFGDLADTGVPPFHWAYSDDAAATMPYDPAAAAALLDEAGWIDRDGDGIRENSDGLPLSFSIKYNTGNEPRRQVAETMAQQLGDLGMDARAEVVEWATLLSQITDPETRDFDGVVMGWFTEYRVDDSGLFHSDNSNGPWAFSGTNNPEIDRLLDELSAEMDRDAAMPLWAEYQRAVNQEQPYTYFYFPQRITGVNRRLQNVVMDARGEWLNVRNWYLDPASR